MDTARSSEIDQIYVAKLSVKWSALLDDLQLHAFGEGEIHEEDFKEAIRDTYYYFKNCFEARRNQTDYKMTMLSIKETALVSKLFAYYNQIICTASEISTKCEIMQLIAAEIYYSITLPANPPLSGFSHAPILKCEGFLDNGEELSFEYDVDKGNLQDIFDLFAK